MFRIGFFLNLLRNYGIYGIYNWSKKEWFYKMSYFTKTINCYFLQIKRYYTVFLSGGN